MKEMMDAADIAFPHLNIYLTNVPKTISIFGFQLAYYGIIISIGVIIAILLTVRRARLSGQDEDIYWDLAIYEIIFCLIGARLYYVIFAWDLYKSRPLSIFNVREGGLAIYGAVIAGFLTTFVYSKIKKIPLLPIYDTIAPSLVLGQCIGRWGNFMNREAFGQYTDSLFAMRLPIAAVRPNEISPSISQHILNGTNYIQVHPTYLYESICSLALFCVLAFCFRKKTFDGEVTLLYLCGYGFYRCLIEGLRTDQLLIAHTNIPVSQALSGSLFIFSLVALIIMKHRQK